MHLLTSWHDDRNLIPFASCREVCCQHQADKEHRLAETRSWCLGYQEIRSKDLSKLGWCNADGDLKATLACGEVQQGAWKRLAPAASSPMTSAQSSWLRSSQHAAQPPAASAHSQARSGSAWVPMQPAQRRGLQPLGSGDLYLNPTLSILWDADAMPICCWVQASRRWSTRRLHNCRSRTCH